MASWIRQCGRNPKQSAIEVCGVEEKASGTPCGGGGGTRTEAAAEYWGIFSSDGHYLHRPSAGVEVYSVAALPASAAFLERLAGLDPRAAAVAEQGRQLRVVVISDTHEFHAHLRLPPGDILLHCGDVLTLDKYSPGFVSNHNLRHFFAWFNKQPFALRIVIAGNHDHQMEKLGRDVVKRMAHPSLYLESELIDVGGLRIFGTPRSTPNSKKSGNQAFQFDADGGSTAWPTYLPGEATMIAPTLDGDGNFTGEWRTQLVPRDSLQEPGRLDFLMTHGAPCCVNALRTALHLEPALHFCGHVHEMHGVWWMDKEAGVTRRPPTHTRHPGRTGFSINGASTRGKIMRERLEAPIAFDFVVLGSAMHHPFPLTVTSHTGRRRSQSSGRRE
jgi:hypothetical protein